MAHSQSRQLALFPQQQVCWDAFSDELQDAIEEVVSLLLECEIEPKEDPQTKTTSPNGNNPCLKNFNPNISDDLPSSTYDKVVPDKSKTIAKAIGFKRD